MSRRLRSKSDCRPGIINDAHIAGWKTIVDRVHAAGSKTFSQLMHAGAQFQANR